MHPALRALRIHQWCKNLLVFVPVVSSQHYDAVSLLTALAAFFAFSFAASAVYVFNDLVDVESDRQHPAKCDRPFARGDLSASTGMVMIPVLLAAAFAVAAASSWRLAAVMAVYLAGTTLYSLALKRVMLIDVIALAVFYTLRVAGGAVAIAVPISEWLVIFCVFIFFALATVKRYAEIAVWRETGRAELAGRDYNVADLPALLVLAAGAAFSAVVVFALYTRSDFVRGLYSRSELMLAICPILIYWLSRLLLLAHRGVLTRDPILFALSDWVSWVTAALVAAVILAAI